MSDTITKPQLGVSFEDPCLKPSMGKANLGYLDLLNKPNITEYRLLSEGAPYTVEIGPHGGGHYVIK